MVGKIASALWICNFLVRNTTGNRPSYFLHLYINLSAASDGLSLDNESTLFHQSQCLGGSMASLIGQDGVT